MEIPKKLYKYRDYDNANHIKSLLESEIYIPSANEFNDPHDSRLPFRYFEDELTEDNIYRKCLELAKSNFPEKNDEQHQAIAYDMQSKRLLWDDHHLEQFDKKNYNDICAKYGIFCLTPINDNFLMWSYYSKSHTGYCLGYDTNFLIDSRIFGAGGSVIYSDEFPKAHLFKKKDDPTYMIQLFHTKWKIWEHEQEYRLRHLYSTGKIHRIPIEFTSELILGCKFDETKKMKFVNDVIGIYPHIKIVQMKLNDGTFGLEKEIVYDPELFL